MGLTDSLRGKRVYFDANIFIYIIEGSDEYQKLIDSLVESLSQNEFHATSSQITFTEVLPPLVRRGDQQIISETLKFMRESDLFQLDSANEDICIQAGVLRGETKMKTPDALHVATSMHQKCDVFLTNDAGIRVPDTMKRVLISDYT